MNDKILTVVMVLLCTITVTKSLPIVDEGLYIMQGVDSCLQGDGYCILGKNCTLDIDFTSTEEGNHCDGLANGFNPPVNFTCCKYNELGKASSVPPTTTHSPVTITNIDGLLQEEAVILEYQEDSAPPEGADLSSVIKIVGVVTDFTGVLGLITEPYKVTIPVQTLGTTPTTPRTPE